MHPPPSSSIRLDPASPSSIYLQPAYFNLHLAWSSSTQLPGTPSTIFEPKYCTYLGNFPKFSPKNSKLSILIENWLNGILEELIPNQDLDFWNSNPKIHFWINLSQKRQSRPFCLKIGTHGTSRMLILIVTLCSKIQIPKFWPKIHFGEIWAKKVKVVCFVCKLTHMVSRGCWFLFQHLFSEFQTKNQFLAKFRPKKSNLSILPENWHT